MLVVREPDALGVCRAVAQPAGDEKIPFVPEEPKPPVEPSPKCERSDEGREMDRGRCFGTG